MLKRKAKPSATSMYMDDSINTFVVVAIACPISVPLSSPPWPIFSSPGPTEEPFGRARSIRTYPLRNNAYFHPLGRYHLAVLDSLIGEGVAYRMVFDPVSEVPTDISFPVYGVDGI